jgi:hypothetical protein
MNSEQRRKDRRRRTRLLQEAGAVVTYIYRLPSDELVTATVGIDWNKYMLYRQTKGKR